VKPTEHVKITGAQADELPVGSVILSPNTKNGDLLRALRDGTWQDGNGRIAAYKPSRYRVKWLVLHVPAPVQPKLGDNLSLEQLEALPDRAGVVDEQGDLWQKWQKWDVKWWYQASKHSGPLPSSEQGRLGRVTLVWLPPTAGDAS